MIDQACPVVVLDDDRGELWSVAHSLGLCGFPVTPHLVRDGQLERIPTQPHSGVRLLFTDLHLLGPTQAKPEQYIGALVSFIRRLIQPSTYLIVFWSNYVDEAAEAWKILQARVPAELCPFAYRSLSKELAKAACDDDETVSAPAREKLRQAVETTIGGFPQLRALMLWESAVSRAASETTNELLRILPRGNAAFDNPEHVRSVLARMAQEALGYPYASTAAAKGMTQALLPMVQDWLERRRGVHTVEIDNFLGIKDEQRVVLPTPELSALLNNFFIHAEGDVGGPLDRGAVVRFDQEYLQSADGFTRDIGLMEHDGDWREAVCREFYIDWRKKNKEAVAQQAKADLKPDSVYAVELSAICDHAQDKQRTQRFLFALFVGGAASGFAGKSTLAHDAVYATPEVTLGGTKGRLLISCRVFLSRPYGKFVAGVAITRLRKDVVDELSHMYATHMRRPGKIAFF